MKRFGLLLVCAASLAQADYQMMMCGGEFGPCQVTATHEAPGPAAQATLDAYTAQYASIGPVTVDAVDSDPGGDVIGSMCVLGWGGDECGVFLFRPSEGFEILQSFEALSIFDINRQGIAVGALDGVAWDSADLRLATIYPDPRLGLPPGDLLTPAFGVFTAIDDRNQIHGQGIVIDSFGNWVTGGEYDLLVPAPAPEPSTWLLLGSGLVGLCRYYYRSRRY